jgi:hypothetical protein
VTPQDPRDAYEPGDPKRFDAEEGLAFTETLGGLWEISNGAGEFLGYLHTTATGEHVPDEDGDRKREAEEAIARGDDI